jgi:hypothetical protein
MSSSGSVRPRYEKCLQVWGNASLFLMVGEEEKKIRSNPVARTTDLLRSVFGR